MYAELIGSEMYYCFQRHNMTVKILYPGANGSSKRTRVAIAGRPFSILAGFGISAEKSDKKK